MVTRRQPQEHVYRQLGMTTPNLIGNVMKGSSTTDLVGKLIRAKKGVEL